MFPSVTGGTLREYLQREKPQDLTRVSLFCSMGGLASAIQTLHGVFQEHSPGSYFGIPKEALWSDHILVDKGRFISQLVLPCVGGLKHHKGHDEELETPERAMEWDGWAISYFSDIFSLGCIFADLLMHFLYGPNMVEHLAEATSARSYEASYKGFRRGRIPHNAVIRLIQKLEGQGSTLQLATLILRMVDISELDSPSAREVTLLTYRCAMDALSEMFTPSFDQPCEFWEVVCEKARYLSWARYYDPAPEDRVGLTHVVGILIRISRILDVSCSRDLDINSLDEIHSLNSELLSTVPWWRKRLLKHAALSILTMECRLAFENIAKRTQAKQQDIGMDYPMDSEQKLNSVSPLILANISLSRTPVSSYALQRSLVDRTNHPKSDNDGTSSHESNETTEGVMNKRLIENLLVGHPRIRTF